MFLVRHGQSEFNVHYSRTGVDPGIRDAPLTAAGRAQAAAAAKRLAEDLLGDAAGAGYVGRRSVRRIVSSPYTRALETAEILAERLNVAIHVEALVGEHAAFACDVGTPPRDLARRWPHLAFDHLPDPWWPETGETEAMMKARAARFRALTDGDALRAETLVVSHWGFIRALTGLAVTNCAIVRFDLHPAPRAVLAAEVTGPLSV